jgi:hypothetical protein
VSSVGDPLGPSALGILDPTDPTISVLTQVGFVLVVFVSGTRLPLRYA